MADTAVLVLGLQDSRFDGADWSLANRGAGSFDPADTAVVWRWRGAPHLVRRADLPAVAAASRLLRRRRREADLAPRNR